jgi:flagellar assembly protein FliH
VDAEEKKLSARVETDAFKEHQKAFRLHCFPDIPFDDADNQRICIPLKDSFQRTRFGKQNTGCDDSSSECESNGTEPSESASSTDEFDIDAYQKGFSDGLAKGAGEGERTGFERASKKLEPLLESLRDALRQLENLRTETLQDIEKEIVELALAIARKVICREVEMDREVVACVAREALARIDDPGKITIKMNPEDLQFIEETSYNLSNMLGSIDNVTLEAEENIQSGGCMIKTGLGEIDARIESQIQVVEESFRNAVDKSARED